MVLCTQSLHDRTFEMNGFVYEIGGKCFKNLWFLMDGIYPELLQFVNKSEALHSIWQEEKKGCCTRLRRYQKVGFLHNPFQMYDIDI
jgi:hypothetical protein